MALDLFTPVVPPERFHRGFKNIIERPNLSDRTVLNEWADGFVDRDGKFVKEFQTTFDSAFWELYLHAALKELEMECDFRWSRPDFCIRAPEPFAVEAAIALHALGTPAVTENKSTEGAKEFSRLQFSSHHPALECGPF